MDSPILYVHSARVTVAPKWPQFYPMGPGNQPENKRILILLSHVKPQHTQLVYSDLYSLLRPVSASTVWEGFRIPHLLASPHSLADPIFLRATHPVCQEASLPVSGNTVGYSTDKFSRYWGPAQTGTGLSASGTLVPPVLKCLTALLHHPALAVWEFRPYMNVQNGTIPLWHLFGESLCVHILALTECTVSMNNYNVYFQRNGKDMVDIVTILTKPLEVINTHPMAIIVPHLQQ